MKVLTRDFTKREKILLVILLLIILGFLYYLLVFEPVSSSIQASRSEAQMLEDQLIMLDAKVSEINNMQKEIARINETGESISQMPSYNAGKQEVDFLHATLAGTEDYYVGFTDITRDGDQIRRNFSMRFTALNYAQMESIFDTLENSDIRCMISDFAVSPADREGNLMTGPVQVTCVATFYETMHDGNPDKELPEDRSAPVVTETDETDT